MTTYANDTKGKKWPESLASKEKKCDEPGAEKHNLKINFKK